MNEHESDALGGAPGTADEAVAMRQEDAPRRRGRRPKAEALRKSAKVTLAMLDEERAALEAWARADTDGRSANEAICALLLREVRAWHAAGCPPHGAGTPPFARAGGPDTTPRHEKQDVAHEPEPDRAESYAMRQARERKRIRALFGDAAGDAVTSWADNTRKAAWKRAVFAAADAGESLPLPPAEFWAWCAAKRGEAAAEALRQDMGMRAAAGGHEEEAPHDGSAQGGGLLNG